MKPTNHDKSDEQKWLELIKQIEANELEYNQRNASKVRDAWCEIVSWNALFDDAGLGFLPDGEDGIFTRGVEVLHGWLVEAYCTLPGNTRKKVIAALEQVKRKIEVDNPIQ
jgi:hypothetical protein